MVAVARLAIRALLPGNPRAEDAELIVSELAINAIRHSTSRGGQFELAVDLEPGRIRIEVKDGGPFGYPPPPEPKPQPSTRARTRTDTARVFPIHPWTTLHQEDLDRDRAAEAEEYGFGLAIVTSASDKWGHSRYPDHAVWWAELAWPADPAPDQDGTSPDRVPANPTPTSPS